MAAARTSLRGGGRGAGDGKRGRARGGRGGRGSRHFFIHPFGTSADDNFREQNPFPVGSDEEIFISTEPSEIVARL